MQSLFTFAAEFVFCSAIALYSYLFIAGLADRTRFVRTASSAPAQPLITAEEEALIPQLTDLWDAPEETEINDSVSFISEPIAPATSKAIDSVVPFIRRRPALALASMTIRELKAIAKAVKLPKYNYCTKVELIDRLNTLCPLEVGQALRVA